MSGAVCLTPTKAIQPPFAHVNITGETYTPGQSADAIAGRPGAIAALKQAACRSIASPDAEAPWLCADIRVLRLHRLLVKVGFRADGSLRLRITDAGRAVLEELQRRDLR